MKPTILVIDDEALVRESIKTVFLTEGYDAILAENGEEGVSKFSVLQTFLWKINHRGTEAQRTKKENNFCH